MSLDYLAGLADVLQPLPFTERTKRRMKHPRQDDETERSNAWAARFRRLARDYEQLAETPAGLHVVAFALLMLKRFVELIVTVHNTL